MNFQEPIANGISPQRILEQVNRIKEDRLFKGSKVLRSFLDHIVSQTLEGRQNQLKEYTIALNVLNKPKDFDPRRDCIVRIHGVRLRKALNDYYQGAGAGDSIRVSLPKGSYIPVFENAQTLLKRDASQGRKVRVTVEMVNTESGEQLWSEMFERMSGDINSFAGQEEIISRMLDAMKQMVKPRRPMASSSVVRAVA